MTYEFFKHVDESSELGRFFNLVFSKLNIPRIIHAPKIFAGKEDERRQYKAEAFYRLCLSEMYLHSIIDNLCKWKKETEEYINEFSCRWRYYASAKRLESIRQYGGDPDDYNPDGSIKNTVDDKILSSYHIAEHLAPSDWNEIFTQTRLTDLLFIADLIIIESKMDIADIFQKAVGGERLKTFRMEDGKMIENDWADDLMRKSQDENNAVLTVDTLFSILYEVTTIAEEMKTISRTDDNDDFFRRLPRRIQNLFDLKNIETFPLSEIIQNITKNNPDEKNN
ncbi:MAG: hypothetical protein LBG15_09355 [Dysgonamonadaceae bacterium]|jgi:hypothetical protein|nr:hypothetical protein [Dysgonamonadaceae bacterium]